MMSPTETIVRYQLDPESRWMTNVGSETDLLRAARLNAGGVVRSWLERVEAFGSLC